MNKRKIVTFSHNQLKLDLVYGKVSLKSIPRAIRLRNRIFYSYAMKYYNYRRNTDNPYDVMYNDINSLYEGYQKEQLIDLYNLYGSDLGLSYEKQKSVEENHFSHNKENLILGISGGGHNFVVCRRLLGRDGHCIG